MPPVDIKLIRNIISGPFMSAITTVFTERLIISFPYLFWENWTFIKPALDKKETKTVTSSMAWV